MIKKIITIGFMALVMMTTATYSETHPNGHEVRLNLPDPSEETSAPDHHALVHPFLAHMGMPDGPAEASFRGNVLRTVQDGVGQNDYGFHIEAGVMDGIGIHLRNDAVSGNATTELMLQAAIWRDATQLSGISLVLESEFKTGVNSESDRLTLLYGISGRWVLPTLSLDAIIHYNPSEKMSEWETSLVYRLTEHLFPILEFNGEIGEHAPIVNALAAVKLKFGTSIFGVGIQYPISTEKEFDSQLRFQVDMGFH